MKKIFTAVVFSTLALSSLSVFAQSQSRESLSKEIAAKRAELAKLENAFLAPSEEDRVTYAEFLRQPDTGLIRLLPRQNTNRQDLTVSGGGAYYSFKDHTHEYGNSSDISLEQGMLSTGFAGANYGLLAILGDVRLETVTLKTAAAQVLSQYARAEDEPHARIEQRRTSDGATIDGVSYKRRQSLQLNSTYVLRAVNYDASDVLVAFRVVRIDNDDSATILWKLLKKYPTPYLARN